MLKRLVIGLVLAVSGLVLAACDGTEANVFLQSDGERVFVTVTMTEANVVPVVDAVLNAQNPGAVRDVTVDLRPGEVHVSAIATEDGVDTAIDFTFEGRATGGDLEVVVTEFNYEGSPLPEAFLDEINREIAAGIAAEFGAENLTNVTITDTELEFSFDAPVD